jgi:hypothetical protein
MANCDHCRRKIGGRCLGEPAGVEERESEAWEDTVGEEIDVKDWWEELGGRQT